MSEVRGFKMHPALLRDVIKKQAGTIQKAILEAAMNSIDAGATKVEITIEPELITISDDGKGFRSREEIESFFETFGFPHEAADAKYGRFRMGRGQMFAFGKNLWRSGTFEMFVDIDAIQGFDLGYTLKENLDEQKGCGIMIELYNPLGTREMHDCTKEIERMLLYTNETVTINGRQVNKPPTLKAFPDSTDQAWIRLKEDGYSLEVYNLGVHVKTYSTSEIGAAGIVVSKSQLDVNFARNDVQHTCKVWKELKKLFKVDREKKVKRKTTLTDDERYFTIAELVAGDLLPQDYTGVQLFKDVSGKTWSARSISAAQFGSWSMGPRNSRLGDKLIQSGSVLVLDEAFVTAFGPNVAELFKAFNFSYKLRDLAYVPLAEAARDLDESMSPVAPQNWTPTERVWLEVLDNLQRNLGGYKWQTRDLRIGSSRTAEAWTDAVSHITFAREWLSDKELVKHGLPFQRDVTAAALLIAHEMCHATDSRDNVHSGDFYQAYHDLTRKVPGAVSMAVGILAPTKFPGLQKRCTDDYHKARRRAKLGGEEAESEVTQDPAPVEVIAVEPPPLIEYEAIAASLFPI